MTLIEVPGHSSGRGSWFRHAQGRWSRLSTMCGSGQGTIRRRRGCKGPIKFFTVIRCLLGLALALATRSLSGFGFLPAVDRRLGLADRFATGFSIAAVASIGGVVDTIGSAGRPMC